MKKNNSIIENNNIKNKSNSNIPKEIQPFNLTST